MRRPSKRSFRSALIFQTKTSGPDSSGDSGSETYSTGTDLSGTAAVNRTGAERVVRYGKEVQLSKGKIIFRTYPVDTSAGARSPGIPQIRDRFLWTNDMNQQETFYATTPALTQADRGQAWVVEFESVT
jgi:hypothetical protein